jgi:hypothetical protein
MPVTFCRKRLKKTDVVVAWASSYVKMMSVRELSQMVEYVTDEKGPAGADPTTFWMVTEMEADARFSVPLYVAPPQSRTRVYVPGCREAENIRELSRYPDVIRTLPWYIMKEVVDGRKSPVRSWMVKV